MKKVFLSLAICLSLSIAAIAQTHYHRLTIENLSGVRIDKMYVSRNNYTNWGSDILGSEYLYANESKYTDLIGHVYYDFKSVDRVGDICTLKAFILDNDKTITIGKTNCWITTDDTQ